MWTRQLILAFWGLMAGGATAAGTFAFVMIIGVVPRMVAKFKCAAATMYVENAIVLGGIVGSILSIFTMVHVPLGMPLLILFGLSSGIFVGGLAVALAEILDTFPILFRRFHVKEGLFWVVTSLAVGKFCGAFFFFLAGIHAK